MCIRFATFLFLRLRMKKLMGFLFVLVFILGIIFVLLPFLETTPPPSAVPAAQARPRPQIFTSNPLTTLVKRIVNALQTEWDKKREKRRLAVARMQEKRKLAPTNYRAALLKTLPSQEEAPGEPIELPQGEDDGNWLIAPQISPEDTAAKGMHEVSITDEPAQSTETITIPLPQEAAAFSVQSEGLPADSAMQDAPVQLARANSVLDIPLPTSATPEQPSQKAPMGETEKALKELMDVVYPERRLAKLVEDYASVKFGLIPATPASLKEKEAFIKEKKEQVIKEFRRLQWEDIMRMLDSQEPPPPPAKDYLGNYVRAAKREGKETIKLPITIVSKEEEGKVRLTKMGPTDLEKLQRVVVALAAGEVEAAGKLTSLGADLVLSTSETAGKAEAVGKVFNPSPNHLTGMLSLVVRASREAAEEMGGEANDFYDEITSKVKTPTPAKKPNKTEEIAIALTKYVSLTETGTPAQTNSGQDDRPVEKPTVPPSSSEPTQGKTPTPATGDQPFKEMWEASIDLAENLKRSTAPGSYYFLKDGYLVPMDITPYMQGAVSGLNEEEKSEEDISMNSSQHPGSLQSRWKKFATGEIPL